MQYEMSKYTIVIHAGVRQSSTRPIRDENAIQDEFRNILIAAEAQLKRGQSALDVAEAAVSALENFPLFNAGKGAVLNGLGECEVCDCLCWSNEILLTLRLILSADAFSTYFSRTRFSVL